MNDRQFDELLESIRDMGRHMRGESVVGIKQREFTDPDVKTIRERTGLSPSCFADIIGVRLRTLKDWEQKRTRPIGPARTLLKIVESNPDTLSVIRK